MDDVWLATVRMARDGGDMSSLFPPGVTRLYELPFTIFHAIRFALNIINMQENMEENEMPPKSIWLDNERMSQWMGEVKRNRENKYKPGGGDMSSMPQNEWVEKLFGRKAA